jgi:hypothetical protein
MPLTKFSGTIRNYVPFVSENTLRLTAAQGDDQNDHCDDQQEADRSLDEGEIRSIPRDEQGSHHA